MKKEIKDYLHLYLGCEVKNLSSGTMKYVLSSIDLMGNVLFRDEVGNEMFLHNWKLILRPLSDMTDEEVQMLLRMKFEYDSFQNFRIEDESTTEPTCIYATGFKHVNNRAYPTLINQHISSLNPEQFKYLLSIAIDLFRLKESGLAIDKTTLKNDHEKEK